MHMLLFSKGKTTMPSFVVVVVVVFPFTLVKSHLRDI